MLNLELSFESFSLSQVSVSAPFIFNYIQKIYLFKKWEEVERVPKFNKLALHDIIYLSCFRSINTCQIMCIRSSKEHITWVLQIERDFIAEYKTEYLGGGGVWTRNIQLNCQILRSILCIEFFFLDKIIRIYRVDLKHRLLQQYISCAFNNQIKLRLISVKQRVTRVMNGEF